MLSMPGLEKVEQRVGAFQQEARSHAVLLKRKKGSVYNKGFEFLILDDDKGDARSGRNQGATTAKPKADKVGRAEAKLERPSFIGDRQQPKDASLSKGLVINKLTTGMKWQERVLKLTPDCKAIEISTNKMLGGDHTIPISDIVYVQVGSEELGEELGELLEETFEPKKTFTNSKASIFISAGEASVRIRLPDEEAAALLAVEIRKLMQSARESVSTSPVVSVRPTGHEQQTARESASAFDTSGSDDEAIEMQSEGVEVLQEEKLHGGAQNQDGDAVEGGVGGDRNTASIRHSTGGVIRRGEQKEQDPMGRRSAGGKGQSERAASFF